MPCLSNVALSVYRDLAVDRCLVNRCLVLRFVDEYSWRQLLLSVDSLVYKDLLRLVRAAALPTCPMLLDRIDAAARSTC